LRVGHGLKLRAARPFNTAPAKLVRGVRDHHAKLFARDARIGVEAKLAVLFHAVDHAVFNRPVRSLGVEAPGFHVGHLCAVLRRLGVVVLGSRRLEIAPENRCRLGACQRVGRAEYPVTVAGHEAHRRCLEHRIVVPGVFRHVGIRRISGIARREGAFFPLMARAVCHFDAILARLQVHRARERAVLPNIGMVHAVGDYLLALRVHDRHREVVVAARKRPGVVEAHGSGLRNGDAIGVPRVVLEVSRLLGSPRRKVDHLVFRALRRKRHRPIGAANVPSEVPTVVLPSALAPSTVPHGENRTCCDLRKC